MTPKRVAASTESVRDKWLLPIDKEIESFLHNMAITDADPALVIRWKNHGKWPLPCQVVFVLKPLTQVQQTEDDVAATSLHGENTQQQQQTWMLHFCD